MKFSEARALHTAHTEFELFTMFSIDTKVASQNRFGNRITPSQWKKLEGMNHPSGEAWGYRPRQTSGGVVDFDSMNPAELAKARKEEQKIRSNKLALLILGGMELDDAITQIGPPMFI